MVEKLRQLEDNLQAWHAVNGVSDFFDKTMCIRKKKLSGSQIWQASDIVLPKEIDQNFEANKMMSTAHSDQSLNMSHKQINVKLTAKRTKRRRCDIHSLHRAPSPGDFLLSL